MNKPVTVFVDSGKAVARLSGPLVLGDTYAVSFSGLSTEEATAAPEMIVLGPKPREIAARSGEDSVLAMTTKPCVEAFGPLPPPPLPRPKQFPHPPPLPNPPVHWRGGPHGSTRMHFYVVAGGQTLAQGDIVLLWAPFEYGDAGEPIQLRGEKGDPGEKGENGEKGDPGRNGVYVAMDGLYAFHISEGGDHPEDGHLWIHAQDESTLYAHDANGNYLLDENGERIPLYYVGDDGHLRYRFFFQDSTHVELDLGKVVTREGLYAFHVSDGSDGEPAGHLMLHGQDLSQLYARDGQGNLILDGDGNPIPLFHIDANGHLHFTFYGNDGQAHESLDLGDVRGPALTWGDLTDEQKAALKGEKGDEGDKGDQGDPLTWDDLTEEQKASLKGEKGDPGEDGMSEEEIVALVEDTMGEADDAPTAGSGNWVTSGGLWSVEQAILARIMALAAQINAIASKTGGALHFKGSVQSASDLPDDGNEPGDTYDVIDEGGMNYAWTGSEWNALGATIDLSAYALKSEVPTVDSTLAVQGAAADAKATGAALAGKQATISDLAAIRSGAEAGATAVQPAALSAYRTASAQDAIDSGKASAADVTAIQNVIPSTATPTNKLATAADIPAAQVQADWDEIDPDAPAFILNKPTIPDVLNTVVDQNDNTLEQFVGQVESFLGGTPNNTDILAQESNTGNLYKQEENGASLLSEPPKINGDSLALSKAIAGEYEEYSSSCAVGSLWTYKGKLYRCITAVTSSDGWDASKWTETSVVDEMGGSQAQADWNQSDSTAPDFIKNKPTIPSAKPTHIYNAAGTDALDDKGQLFVSTVGGNYFMSGTVEFLYLTFDGTKYIWGGSNSYQIRYNPTTGVVQDYNPYTSSLTTRATVSTGLDPTQGDVIQIPSGTQSLFGTLTFYPYQQTLNSTPYAKFALESLPDRTWAAGTWNVGDLVKYDGKAYRCIAAATSSNTTVPSSDTTHWAQIALLADKAPLASPAFTGTPKAPTASAGTNTTQIATTAFVQQAKSLLPYASTTTLAPETAVYRATATLSGTTATMPTVTITGIPTASAYFAFELEVAVDATATALDDTAWSGWTWMDGGELPTADYAGKTLYIACRLDCTARTIKANCYEVA